jgi:AcrR family transcriptional regulator
MAGPARRDRPLARRIRDEQRNVREQILEATRSLLADRRFADLAVADILTEARIARASFYFYFESKHAVLAELARLAVNDGHAAAQPWLTRDAGEDPIPTLRDGIAEGARVWKQHAPVLRAMVENWRDDPELSALWTELMDSYTDAAIGAIERDRAAHPAHRTTAETRHVVAALTWLGERLYYLATIDVAPFNDENVLIDVLLEMWTTTVYRGEGTS